MRNKKSLLIVAMAGSLVVTACSSSNGGASSSSTSSSTSSSSSSSSSSAAPPAGSSAVSTSESATAPVSTSESESATAPAGSASGADSSPAGSSSTAPAPSSSAGGGTPLENTGKELNIFGLTEGDEVSKSRIDYGKEQAKVSVKLDENGFDQQKFATALQGGSAPSGALMDRTFIATYAQKGLIQPIDDCISANGIDMSQFYPAAVADVTYNGHVYGIPNDYSFRAVLLNNRVLSAAGLKAADIDVSNWDQLLAQTTKMYKESGGKPSVLGFDPKVDSNGFLQMWAMANGGSMISADGKPTLNDPKVVEALQYTVSLINAQGGWANFKSFRDTWDFFGKDNEFSKDQVGGFPFEQWYPNVLAGFAKTVDLSAVPFKDRQGNSMSFESGNALVVTKGSDNVGGMCAFMKAYSSVEAWDKAGAARDAVNKKSGAIFTGLFAANKAATDKLKTAYLKPTGDAKFDAVIKTYYDSLDAAKAIPGSPAGADIQTAYQNAVTNALNGKDAKAELDAAQQTAQDAYDDAMSS